MPGKARSPTLEQSNGVASTVEVGHPLGFGEGGFFRSKKMGQVLCSVTSAMMAFRWGGDKVKKGAGGVKIAAEEEKLGGCGRSLSGKRVKKEVAQQEHCRQDGFKTSRRKGKTDMNAGIYFAKNAGGGWGVNGLGRTEEKPLHTDNIGGGGQGEDKKSTHL